MTDHLSIAAYLKSQGWKEDIEAPVRYEYISPSGDYCVDLMGDSAWELQRFSDSDIDGVAKARWVRMDVEGETVNQLWAALLRLGITAAEPPVHNPRAQFTYAVLSYGPEQLGLTEEQNALALMDCCREKLPNATVIVGAVRLSPEVERNPLFSITDVKRVEIGGQVTYVVEKD